MLTIDFLAFGGHPEDTHAPFCRQAGFVITGVFDPKPERAALAVKIGGKQVRVYKSEDELFTQSQADALAIATLDTDHPKHLLRAEKYHVIIEKPLATTSSGLQIVRKAFAASVKNKRIIASCHPRDDDKPYKWLNSNIKRITNELGGIQHITLRFSYPPPKNLWKKQRSLADDHFTHELHELHRLLGNQPFTAKLEHDSYNEYKAIGTFGGTPYTCHGDRKAQHSEFREWVIIEGKNGSECVVDCDAGFAQLGNRRIPIGKTDYDGRSLAGMKKFAHAIHSGKPPIPLNHLLLINDATVKLVEQGYYRHG